MHYYAIDQIKKHVLHNFTKYFFDARVNQIVNKCFNS